ncbi:MAG TPA: M56 family metallopeptidase, partial [Gaiellaceae bacterium]|nr:M56 family metallopeptidase [Gaiellaceae bacterium]
MSAERRPRLNPFAFPSDTVFRFGLLVVAVLGANLYVWQWIASTTRSTDEHLQGTRACLAVVAQGPDAFSGCVSDLYRYQVSWMVGGTIALALASSAILLAYPVWIARRRRLVPLSADDAPAAVARVRELAAELGVDSPALLWNPLDASPTGLAFGRPGRYAVAVGGGLVVKQATDPAAFDAVVRHELAHLRNRDVGVTYLTLATWYAFLAVAVLPFAVTLLTDSRNPFLGVTWRLLALALLVYLTRNAVLRSREVYADVRASTTDGPEGALRRVVGGLPARRRDLLGRTRAVPPPAAERLSGIDVTRPLFPLGVAAAFAAGLSSTIAYES